MLEVKMLRGLITVIIPVYKVEKYLNQCIQSVVGQTYTNLEIILVDDGSPDSCPSICDEWALKDERIKVIHKKNGGLSDARNAGLEIAQGEYIAFVDSDDWIMSDMYERLLRAIQEEQADISACNIKSCYEDHEITWGCGKYTVGNSEQILTMLYNDTKYPVSALNKLYRRECWKNLQFPVGKICEDAFTTYKLVHNADKIVQITDALYCYRIRPQSIMTSGFSTKKMDEEEAWRCNCDFIKINYPRLYKSAFDFYLQKVHGLCCSIPKEQRLKYKSEFEYLKSVMQKNCIYVIVKSRMSLKYRVKYTLDMLRM